MLGYKPIMGWNSWNTFGPQIHEDLIKETADVMVAEGYLEAGYNYVIIDDCWSLHERVDGRLKEDPKLFPSGMKALADYIHAKGLKFGIYSCAGFQTCAGFPGSFGYEYEDAKTFAEWGVDYLKYDFCNFPASADKQNAYLTMSMALRNSGRDIVFAACNWGKGDPATWMRSRGAHTFRSTGDLHDNAQAFIDIFKSQVTNFEHNGPGCYNDLDMLIVGMHGKGNVGLGGCTDKEYALHFAMWAFLGSPLIIGADIRRLDETAKRILLNPSLIAINQDDECRPAFKLKSWHDSWFTFMRILDGGRFAIALFDVADEKQVDYVGISFDDLGIRTDGERKVKLTDAVTGEVVGIFDSGIRHQIYGRQFKLYIGEIVA